MRTLAQERKAPQRVSSDEPAVDLRLRLSRDRDARSSLCFQRAIGNQAAQRLLEADARDAGEGAAAIGAHGFGQALSQRSVRSTAPTAIQPKLTVNTPGDAYEQEADQVADTVMRMPGHGASPAARDECGLEHVSPISGSQAKGVSRKPIADEEDVPIKDGAVAEKLVDEKAEVQRKEGPGAGGPKLDPEVEARVHAMRGRGRPLSLGERQFMEPRFGADFSRVGIHTGQEADAYSRGLNARAFTLGSDIFFRAGEYEPSRTESQRLLAHELTHTVQQGAARPLNGRHRGARGAGVPAVQRQAPPAAPARVVVPAGRATINFLPILHDRVPTGWGVTVNDDPVFDITAYADGAAWKCVITKADQQSHQGTRLVAGVVEVTDALVAAESSCATLKTMITSLNSVADQGAHSGYYMLAAVQAHEDVHIRQYRAGLAPHYATLKAAIEALSVPAASHPDAAAAKAAIKALPAYAAAMATFHAGDVAVNNASGKHTPAAPFITAEHGVVDPMIATIRARRTALKCAP